MGEVYTVWSCFIKIRISGSAKTAYAWILYEEYKRIIEGPKVLVCQKLDA